MSTRDILVFLFKWKGTIFGWFALVALTVTLAVYIMPRTYLAQARVLIEYDPSPVPAAMPRLDNNVIMNSEAEVVVSRPVIAAVVDQLRPYEGGEEEEEGEPGVLSVVTGSLRQMLVEAGLVDPPMSPREQWIHSLLQRLRAQPEVSSAILTLTLPDTDPQRAAVLLNAVIHQYVARRPAVFAAKGPAQFYRTQTNTSIVEPAHPPEKPAMARLPLIMVGIFGGAILAIGIAMLREYFDKTVQSPEVAESILPGVPMVGSIELCKPWMPRVRRGARA
ncbi:MAG: hypothetical protein WCZ23_03550 [Rhodospirillaceae bacterium]